MKKRPLFSIVIPTYNRPRQLDKCLEAVARLKYPRDRFEAIVVDDGSDIPPEAVVARYRDRFNVKLIGQSNAGPAAARNTGAVAATGDILAFTDDDCWPAPSWLQALAARLKVASNYAVGGRTINALPNCVCSTAHLRLLDFYRAHFNGKYRPAFFFTSSNLAVPAEHFRALGGFDSSFRLAAGEDLDFCDRWLQRGRHLVYAPDAIVYHEQMLTLRSFWRQQFDYGAGAFQLHRACAQRGSGRFRIDPLSLYLDMLRFPFRSPDGSRGSLTLSALVLVSQVANAAGFVSTWASRAARGSSLAPGRDPQ